MSRSVAKTHLDSAQTESLASEYLEQLVSEQTRYIYASYDSTAEHGPIQAKAVPTKDLAADS